MNIRYVVCVGNKGQNVKGSSPNDEYKDFCACLLKCTCIEMMWSVYEIIRLYTLQDKYYT